MGLLYLVDVPDEGENLYHLSDEGVLTNETTRCRVGSNKTPGDCWELFTRYLGGTIIEIVDLED